MYNIVIIIYIELVVIYFSNIIKRLNNLKNYTIIDIYKFFQRLYIEIIIKSYYKLYIGLYYIIEIEL